MLARSCVHAREKTNAKTRMCSNSADAYGAACGRCRSDWRRSCVLMPHSHSLQSP